MGLCPLESRIDTPETIIIIIIFIVVIVVIIIIIIVVIADQSHSTSSYKKTILGSRQPVSGIKFFCRFSLRLSEKNRSRVMFIAKFGPTASDFGYEILTIFG